MKNIPGRFSLMILTVVFSLLGFTFRRFQLRFCFDENGLSGLHREWVYALVFLLILAFALFALLLHSLPIRERFADNFRGETVSFLLASFGALMLLVGSAGTIYRTMQGTSRSLWVLVPAFCGVVAAFCIFSTAAGQYKNKPPMKALYLIPFFYLAIRLVAEFKNGWGSDPIILNFCFSMFALIATMSAAYHLVGFCYDKGRRTRTVFWCILSVILCITVLADSGNAVRLTYLGIALWLVGAEWDLLSPTQSENSSSDT